MTFGKMKNLAFATFLLVALLLSSSFFDAAMAGSSFGDSKSTARCSKAGRMDRCLEYRGICCEKCQCVLSGTHGHKDEYRCYRDMKNSKGQSKCVN